MNPSFRAPPASPRVVPTLLLARLPRDLRAAPLRPVSLLPPPHAQPVGRRGPRAGRDGARVRHARTDGGGAAEPAGVALSRRLEPLARSAATAATRRAARRSATKPTAARDPRACRAKRRHAPRAALAAGARGRRPQGRLRSLARGDRRSALDDDGGGEGRAPPRARQARRAGPGGDARRRRRACSTRSARRSTPATSIGLTVAPARHRRGRGGRRDDAVRPARPRAARSSTACSSAAERMATADGTAGSKRASCRGSFRRRRASSSSRIAASGAPALVRAPGRRGGARDHARRARRRSRGAPPELLLQPRLHRRGLRRARRPLALQRLPLVACLQSDRSYRPRHAPSPGELMS